MVCFSQVQITTENGKSPNRYYGEVLRKYSVYGIIIIIVHATVSGNSAKPCAKTIIGLACSQYSPGCVERGNRAVGSLGRFLLSHNINGVDWWLLTGLRCYCQLP